MLSFQWEIEQEDKQGRDMEKKEQAPTHPEDACLPHAQLPASQHTPFHTYTSPSKSISHLLPPLEPQPIPLIQRLRLSKQNLRRQITILTYLPIVLEQANGTAQSSSRLRRRNGQDSLVRRGRRRGYLGPVDTRWAWLALVGLLGSRLMR